MILKAKLTENDQVLKANFGEVHIVERGGYEQGYEQGKKDGYTNGYNEGYTKGDSEGYDKGYADGENSVVDYTAICSTIQFDNLNLFGKSEVVLNLPRVYDLSYLGSPRGKKENTNTTVEHITVNCPNEVITLRGAFAFNGNTADNTLKRITLNIDTKKVTTCEGAFSALRALEVVDGAILDMSSVTANGCKMFADNLALEEIRFVPNTISARFVAGTAPKLSPETIQSIIDGLADLTGQTAQTITFHKDVGAKLSEEQKATITAKNWTLVY